MNASKTLIPLAMIVALATPTATLAAKASTLDAGAAMRKGIRDYARHGLDGSTATASKLQVACRPVPKVGQLGACTGTFRLTLDGRSADYRLTTKARTLRISPGAIEYRLSARTATKVPGLPLSIGAFSGFLQYGHGSRAPARGRAGLALAARGTRGRAPNFPPWPSP